MKKNLIVKTLALLLISFYSTAFAGNFKVLRVVDGDTIDVDFKGQKERVRFLFVDTPESVHPNRSKNSPMGTTASLYTKNKLLGKSVDLKFEGQTRGKYKRLLAYVFLDDLNLNLDLVEKGLSPYYTRYGSSKAYDQKFKDAEQRAQKKGLNIWSTRAQPIKNLTARRISSEPTIFHGNKSSKSFHKPSCRYFNCKQCTEIFHTKDEAIQAGFKPCGICF